MKGAPPGRVDRRCCEETTSQRPREQFGQRPFISGVPLAIRPHQEQVYLPPMPNPAEQDGPDQ